MPDEGYDVTSFGQPWNYRSGFTICARQQVSTGGEYFTNQIPQASPPPSVCSLHSPSPIVSSRRSRSPLALSSPSFGSPLANPPQQASTACAITDAGTCIATGAFKADSGSSYANSERCEYTTTQRATLHMSGFQTESGYDELTVGSVAYSGASGPATQGAHAHGRGSLTFA